MTTINNFVNVFLLVFLVFFVIACGQVEPKIPSLADWDIESDTNKNTTVVSVPKNPDEIQKAYNDYLKNASNQEKNRSIAINRLARLEIENLRSIQDKKVDDENSSILDDAEINSLQKTANLLTTSLNDFPNENNSDITLYQLAKIYEKLGRPEDALLRLKELSLRFPQSDYFAESKFRIGEYEFLEEDYLNAEMSYTDVIFSGGAHPLYEKALIKRGWARLKQKLYADSIEDFSMAIQHRKFESYKTLSSGEKSDFDEYFRALTLAIRSSDEFGLLENYFSSKTDTAYIYQVYFLASQFELREKNYDGASKLLDKYMKLHAQSAEVLDAQLYQLMIFRLSGATEKYTASMDRFYKMYEADLLNSSHKNSVLQNKEMTEIIRKNILILADLEHNNFRKNKSIYSLDQAKLWYERYLKHFKGYARKDKVYTAYGELLVTEKSYERALYLFEMAAYDGDIVLDKEAAYATIDISNKLLSQNKKPDVWLDKLIEYASRSIKLYGSDQRYQIAFLHSLEQAYKYNKYDTILRVSNELPTSVSDVTKNQVNYLQSLSYLKLNNPYAAESLLLSLLQNPQDPKRLDYGNALALSLYNQGKTKEEDGEIKGAVLDWIRIANTVPEATIAADSLYEAINLSVNSEYWEEAAFATEMFQQKFPKHTLYKDATRQLSLVYLKLGKTDRAAIVFESIAKQDSDKSVKMAALWQAAELYASQKKTDDAIRAYSDYAKTYNSPYPQYIEAMNKLVDLYEQKRNVKDAYLWRHKILTADRASSTEQKNSRTLTIAANTALKLAEQEHYLFGNIRLVEPLDRNLKLKKTHMQNAISLYGQAASFQIADATLQATHSIGDIYYEFSKQLMSSQRPHGLTEDELEQYNILLEDQAFPFEEKSIEFYEINMARTADGYEGSWIMKSMESLRALFPSRYDRKFKTAIYNPLKEVQ